MAVGNNNEIEKKLWDLADELRANSKLKSSEFSIPVLGLIFLRFADHRFSLVEDKLVGKATGRRQVGRDDYHVMARGLVYTVLDTPFSSADVTQMGLDKAQTLR